MLVDPATAPRAPHRKAAHASSPARRYRLARPLPCGGCDADAPEGSPVFDVRDLPIALTEALGLLFGEDYTAATCEHCLATAELVCRQLSSADQLDSVVPGTPAAALREDARRFLEELEADPARRDTDPAELAPPSSDARA